MHRLGWSLVGRILTRSVIAALAGACTLWSTSSTTTVVTVEGPRGTLTYECRGETPISGDACQAWGERVESEPGAVDAVRIVLTDRQGVGGCLADFQDDEGVLYASAEVACP